MGAIIQLATNCELVGGVVENSCVHVNAVSSTTKAAIPRRLTLVPPFSIQ